MARARRKTSARKRLNLEIVGIAAFGIAILCGISLALPHHAGNIGALISDGLHGLFGGAAWLFPVIVALFGGIIFLEVKVPALIASHGTSALVYFLILDAMFGAAGAERGGLIGGSIWWALSRLVGYVGAWVVLVLVLLSLTVWLTNVSLKQLIGRAIVFFGGLKLPKLSMPVIESEGHASVREAFSLPKPEPKAPKPARAYDASADDDDDDAPDEVEVEVEHVPAIVPVGAFRMAPQMPLALVEEADVEPPAPAPQPRAKAVVGEYEPSPKAAPEPPDGRPYRLPDLSLFDPPQAQIVDDSNRAHVLEDTLASFGVGAKVIHIERGPSITRYE
ncbi:MAG TPA: DNA translocase FtsK 4TM domain-containing protein, partial [Candidatus Acidoferrales bacterium]|nr:DNA translocase FtsK 4TM domain-containing protein [Candidatus Acidoferrales bacterium]